MRGTTGYILAIALFSGCRRAPDDPRPKGVVDIFANGRLSARFVEVDRLYAAAPEGTCSVRTPCGYGHGFRDVTFDYRPDTPQPEFFEVNQYGTAFRYYANPLDALSGWDE